MIGMIGKKLGMTQIFNEQGQQIPVTVIEAEPNPVLAVTDKAKVGHASVQLGLGTTDIDNFYAAGQAEGIVFTSPPTDVHGTRIARFRDLDGAEISVSQI